jgi:hypothetical protein
MEIALWVIMFGKFVQETNAARHLAACNKLANSDIRQA